VRRRFPRDVGALDEIFGFIADFLAVHEISEENAFSLGLIVEELFTNFVKYNEGREDIHIQLQELRGEVEVRLTDFNVRPFDVTQVAEPDIDQPISRRQPGGLGIHLVRKLADGISYEYADGNSVVTVIMRLGG
jgi:anti-sigma regulatory factor (Ser/Thr protein kinase)